MDFSLTLEELAKIVSTLPLDDIENRLNYNWQNYDYDLNIDSALFKIKNETKKKVASN